MPDSKISNSKIERWQAVTMVHTVVIVGGVCELELEKGEKERDSNANNTMSSLAMHNGHVPDLAIDRSIG